MEKNKLKIKGFLKKAVSSREHLTIARAKENWA